MDDNGIVEEFKKVKRFFNEGDYEQAVELLQKCIDRDRVLCKQLMLEFVEETPNAEIGDRIQHMYFLNYI